MTERFTVARMEPYLIAANGDPSLTVKLYQWNIRIGAAFYGDLGIIEILLRNTLDGALRNEYQQGADDEPWYDQDGVLFKGGYESVDEAKKGVRKYLGLADDVEPDQDDVTARLGFGFWSMLLSTPSYRGRLGPLFRQSFLYPSGNPVHLEDVAIRTGDLSELRNAIAHHHPIFDWDFDASTTNVSDLAGWMSQPIRAWLFQQHSRVADVLRENPLSPRPG
jgi:hypothetical protein